MNIELYDTTLRDGAQQSGISLSLKDKINITLKLDELGIDTIEGGYAGSNLARVCQVGSYQSKKI